MNPGPLGTATWKFTPPRLDPRWLIGVLAAALVAAVAGYLIGTHRSGPLIHTGTAYSTQGQIGIRGEDGWFYNIPLDVNWIDKGGGWHEGSRPECLPPSGASASPITFAATEVSANGLTWRQVVWVSCR